MLPLDLWREILAYHPWHFWGLVPTQAPVTASCNTVVPETAWQAVQRVGRAEIRRAIETAETRLREYLGYDVAPRYTTHTVQWPPYQDVSMWNRSRRAADGYAMSVQYPLGYVQALGVEVLEEIEADVAITYSDPNGDGLNDRWTLTVNTTVTDPNEIVVYFKAADRLNGEGAGERWQIEPIEVSISGGVATVQGNAWLLVRPINYQYLDIGVGLNPATAGVLATELDVYRRYTDAAQQATLLWESNLCPGWASSCALPPGNNSTDPAAVAQAAARVGIRDSRLGLLTPGQAQFSSGEWSAVCWNTAQPPPNRVTINALAGVPLSGRQMSRQWQEIVARLAAAELARPICGCEDANRELYRWQFDGGMQMGGSNGERYNLSLGNLANPLGQRFGAIYAWNQIKNLRLGSAVLV